MGVTGLWKLIDRAGKQVALESLEGKIFAVDASVLLHQALKGMKDQPNAHLHVLFLRLCKLLMYRIKPIFVFDGAVPILKRQTIAARQKRREESSALAQSIRERLKRKAVQRLAIDSTLGRPSSAKRVRTSEQDLFELPPIPKAESDEGEDDYFELPIHSMLYSGELDVSQVRIDSEEFNALPLEYQHEILEELKDQTKHDNASFSIDAEEEADDFSSFQIAKLVKSNILTNKIEMLRKEMLAGLSDHASDPNSNVLQANRVMSEDSTHYLLIKNLAPASNNPDASSSQQTSAIAGSSQTDRVLDQLTTVSKDLDSEHSGDSDGESADDSLRSYSPFTHQVPNNETSKKIFLRGDEQPVSPNLSETDSEDEEVLDVIPSVDLVKDTSTMSKVSTNSVQGSSADTVPLSAADDSISYQLATVCKSLFDAYTQENLKTSKNTAKLEEVEASTATPIKANVSSVKADTEVVDTEVVDTEVGDTEVVDTEMVDTEVVDTEMVDTEVVDTEVVDTGVQKVSAVKPNLNLGEDDTNGRTSLNTMEHEASAEELNERRRESDMDTMQGNVSPCDTPVHLLRTDSKKVDHDLENTGKQESTHNPLIAGLAEEILHSDRDISEVNEELRTNQTHLNLDLEKQNAASLAVTQRILDDSMELLRLFGVPYVVSPSEAEAQCAQLELLGLCDGTITEDSDVWLFGGCRVLKNFFHHDRFVTSFAASDVQRYCGLDRKKFIAVALVCGSDYTEGIFGAGPVTATEILSEFGQDCDGITAMAHFKTWIEQVKINPDVLPHSTSNSSVRRKLKRHADAVPDAFPNRVVVDAYLNPRVDDSTESFEWGRPDLDLIRKFAHKTLNWPSQKVDDLVCPVLKKLNTVQSQPKLTDFFSSFPTSINSDATFQSKRLKHAFSKLTTPSNNSEPEQPSTNLVKSKKQKQGLQRNAGSKNAPKGKSKSDKALTNVNRRVVQEQVCLSEDSDE